MEVGFLDGGGAGGFEGDVGGGARGEEGEGHGGLAVVGEDFERGEVGEDADVSEGGVEGAFLVEDGDGGLGDGEGLAEDEEGDGVVFFEGGFELEVEALGGGGDGVTGEGGLFSVEGWELPDGVFAEAGVVADLPEGEFDGKAELLLEGHAGVFAVADPGDLDGAAVGEVFPTLVGGEGLGGALVEGGDGLLGGEGFAIEVADGVAVPVHGDPFGGVGVFEWELEDVGADVEVVEVAAVGPVDEVGRGEDGEAVAVVVV